VGPNNFSDRFSSGSSEILWGTANRRREAEAEAPQSAGRGKKSPEAVPDTGGRMDEGDRRENRVSLP